MAAAIRSRATQLAQQVQKTVRPAYEWTEKNAVGQYTKLMADNQQYVVKDPKEADKLLKQYVFTNLSRYDPCDSPQISCECNKLHSCDAATLYFHLSCLNDNLVKLLGVIDNGLPNYHTTADKELTHPI